MKSKPTDNPFAQLDAILNRTPEPTGPEWFTSEQYAHHTGLTVGRCRDTLRKLVADGLAVQWTGTMNNAEGTPRKTCKYRLK